MTFEEYCDKQGIPLTPTQKPTFRRCWEAARAALLDEQTRAFKGGKGGQADIDLLAPLAAQIKAAMQGVARDKLTEQQIINANAELFFILADHVRNYLKANGVRLVKLQ